MSFFLCGRKNKEDAKDPPYSGKAGIEDASARLLEEERELVRQESMRLRRELDETKKKLEESERLTGKVRDLTEQVNKYKHQLADIEKEKQAVEKKVQSVETEKVDLEKKLQSAARDKADGVQSNISKDVTNKLESDLLNLKNVKGKIEEERDSAQRKLDEMKVNYHASLGQLESQMEKIKKEKHEAEERLKKAQDEADEKIKTVKHEKDTIENTLAHTKKQLEIAQKESHIPRSPTGAADEWMNKLKAAETELKKERDARLEKEKDLSRLANEKEEINKEKLEILQEIQSMQIQTDEIKRNTENAERSARMEKDRLQAEYKQLLSEKDAANDQLLTRLSSITAAQVLDGNPNVSDISDPNRPQKLGEQLSTLYDDQWTDASEELEKMEKFAENEELIVTTLFELLKSVYNHCKEASDNQLSRIEEYIFLPPLENPPPSSPDTNGTDTSPVKSPTSKQSTSKIPRFSSLSARGGQKIPRFSSHKSRPTLPNLTPGKKTVDSDPGKDKDKKKRSNASLKMKGEKVPEVPVEVRRGIKEYRKMVAKQVIPVIEKEVLQKLCSSQEFSDDVVDACKPFITKSVEICWRMCVQDPPVCLKWDIPVDYKFDADRYRSYTQSGSHVQFVVWPVIYLNEGGPILMKGVAQGKDGDS